MLSTLPSAASDVFTTELDLSAVIRNVATTVGGIVGVSKRGPLGPTLITNKDDFQLLYGKSDPSLGFMHLCSLDFFKRGTALQVNRVCGAGFAYGGILLQQFGSVGSRVPRLFAHAIADYADPSDGINWGTAGSVATQNENLAYIYPIGPGADYDMSLELVSDNILQPANVTLTKATTGGTIGAGTYQYQVSAIGALGETVPTTAVSTTVASGTTNKITVSWDPVQGATGYKIYGRSSGSMGYLGSVPSSKVSWVDTGSAVASGTVPTTGYTETDLFTLKVYDNSQSSSLPVETFVVTLEANSDGFGNQTELEDVINGNSRYIRCVSNVGNITEGLPTFNSIAKTDFAAGDDGDTVTDSDVVAGWDEFADKDEVRVNVLINGGRTGVSVHQKMIALATARRDCIYILDVDPNLQQVQNVLNYRLNTLQANNSRGMLVAPDYRRVDVDNNKLVWCPPSGAVAAMCALTDFITHPGTSPAGANRGVIEEALELRYKYDYGMRAQLAAAQCSYLRTKTGIGIYLAEQLTLLSKFSALSFLSVRRMFDVLESAIETALQFTLHENNTDFTAVQVQAMLSTYLNQLKRNEQIRDFAIKLDRTPATRGQGVLGIDIRVEPTLPINQIALRAIITRQGEVSFTETV